MTRIGQGRVFASVLGKAFVMVLLVLVKAWFQVFLYFDIPSNLGVVLSWHWQSQY